ncbi:MAG: hypothetical protein ACOYXR_09840 [Nitrospirota bacterium]
MIQVARRFVGTVHFFQGPSKSNPVALYARKQGADFVIAAVIEPWNTVLGAGPTINKAAGNFEINWKAQPIPAEQYSGPHWEEGIKAEKPAPPPKPAAPAPAAGTAAAPAQSAPAPAAPPAAESPAS